MNYKNDIYRNEFIERVNHSMGAAVFFYEGEVFDKDYNSIDYLPDLAWEAARIAGMDFADEDELSIFIQCNLYDSVLERYGDGDSFYKMYAQAVKQELFDTIGNM